MKIRSRIENLASHYSYHALVCVLLCIGIFYGYFVYRYGAMLGGVPKELLDHKGVKDIQNRIFISQRVYIALCLVFFMLAAMVVYEKKLRSKTDNIVERLEWTINRLTAIENLRPKENVSENTRRWPWGAHHTDALGHLEAAAARWWTFYDPTDPSTAPTNEMVAEWLRDERFVSKEKAYAIASILRADGLKTGPRR